jgi:hypothetical protein
MIKDNPNEDLYHIKKAYYVRTGVIDEQGNEIVNVQYERPDQKLFDMGLVETKFNNKRMTLNNAQNKEHEVVVMVNGQRITMVFENPEVANAINKNNIRLLPEGFFGDRLREIGRFTRWLTANFTSKNPAFIAPNTVRDVAYAFLSHAVRGGGKDAAKFAKYLATANIAMSHAAKGKDTKYAKYYRDFMENGAATGYVFLKDIDQIGKDVEKAFTRAKRAKDGSFIFNKDGYLRVWKKSGEIMEALAQRSENMSRLATYILAVENGKTPAEAATEAKNITVNFNRKGTESTLFGSLYAFMNASIQGGENLARLAWNHKGKFITAASAMYAWGFLTALLSHINDDDEEDNPNAYKNINDYMKQNNFTIRYGKDRYISIPLPHGWRLFYGMGVSTMENLFLDEEKKHKFNWARENRAWDKLIFDFIDSSIDATSSVNPMDAIVGDEVTLGGAIKVVTPTAFMPIADIATNRDFAGRTIRREPFTKQLEEMEADAGLYKRNVNFILKEITDKIYQAGGGDVDIYAEKVLENGELKKVPEWADWNPSNIEHIITYLTGGRGRFYNQLIKTTSSVVAGASNWAHGNVEGIQEVDMNDVPIINRFNRQAYDYGPYSRYYRLKDDIAAYNYAINKYGIEKKVQNINPKYEMLDGMVKDIDKQLEGLREMRSMVPNQPEKWKELKQKEKEIIENFLNSIEYDYGN